MGIKILHSADWHLGQYFYRHSRLDEHRSFFHFLLQTIEQENIDLHIVAGDIFDTSTPTNDASSLYYDFIYKTSKLCPTVIIGGNHDSPGFLNAPTSLLRNNNVYMTGCLPEHLEDTLMQIQTNNGEILVAAVPYLRERDIYKNIGSLTPEEMGKAIRKGIRECYQNVAHLCKHYENTLPIIATGHLTVLGGSLSGSERNIHIGNIDSIDADQFPDIFSYIALGHLHRSQKVAEHVCYAGSPIPLSFSEAGSGKSLRIIEIDAKASNVGTAIIEQKFVPIPTFRPLYSLQGTSAELQTALENISAGDAPLAPWIELIAHEEKVQEPDDYHRMAATQGCEILKISLLRSEAIAADEIINIEELTPQMVFEKRLEQYQGSMDQKILEQCFQSLVQELEEGK